MRLIWQRGLRLVVDVSHTGLRERHKRLCYNVTGKVHPRRVCLNNGCRPVDINNQPGQKIPLAMHQAVCIVVGACEPQGLPQLKRRFKSVFEKLTVDCGVGEVKNPHRDAPDLEVPDADHTAV